MNLLAFNTELSAKLRLSTSFAVGIIPIGLIFLSFGPLYFFAQLLSSILGIPENAPVKEQPNGILWISIILTVMVVFMIAFYLAGFLINMILAHFILKWPWKKVRNVFVHSDIPESWLKDKFRGKTEQGG
jgi:hypothetical protein